MFFFLMKVSQFFFSFFEIVSVLRFPLQVLLCMFS